MGVDAFFAAQLGGEGDVGQLGGAVLQGVFGKGGFHGQGLAFAAYLGVVYFHFRAGTQTDALLAAAVADEDEVLQYGVGNGSGGVVAAVVVALHQAVAVVAQCGFGFLVSHEVGAFAVPAFGPVEGVVATAYGYEVAHVYRAAEELKAIVGTFVGLAVVHDGTVAYAVERDTVGFVLFIEGKAGVFQANVLQRARVVGIIVAAVNGAAYFRTSLAAFGIGVGASADVYASPCARLFFFAGHYDGFVRRAYGVDFTALLHEDVNLRASVVIASMLPIAVLATFILMRYTGIEANIVALSGIAIAIGVMVDVGVVFVESIIRYMEMPENRGITKGKALAGLIYKAVSEVSGAIATAMITTIVSFLPVFAMQAQEGKMFSPLAYTKTYALASAFVLGLILLPTLAYFLFSVRIDSKMIRRGMNYVLIGMGVALCSIYGSIPALGLTAVGVNNLLAGRWKNPKIANYVNIAIALLVALFYLSEEWLPMGPGRGLTVNVLFVAGCVAIILAMLWALVIFYERILRWCLANRWKFMMIPVATVVCGFFIWRGVGQEFMPSLNEGSFLLMPTSMPHAGIEQNLDYVEKLDKRLAAIPEVETAIGKWGRVNSALDPAPVQMFENTINYRPEYILDEDGRRARFRVDGDGAFVLKDGGTYNPADGFRLLPADSLVADPRGDYFRQWRPEIKNANDIWQQIVNVTHLPGLTSAPKLQPIEARLVMLSTGMRAPMGVKVYGPTLEDIEQGGKLIEQALKSSPSVIPSSVFYDRAVGAPYLEIKLNRESMARYGVAVGDLQEVLGAAVGGMALTRTVEGRERFPIRLRYARELRDSPEALSMLLVPTATGAQVPLKELADIEYSRGAQMIQSENTFLVGYVIFDKLSGRAEVDVVHEAGAMLDAKVKSGELVLPKGVSYKFAGNYEQQQRATDRLMIVVPLALLIVLLVLYFQFRTVTASLIHFSGVFVAFAGGFILLWLYGQPWFMNFSIAGENMRDLFQMHPINLSVAVWVGFIALFGVATDDGVLMGTYIHHVFLERDPRTRHDIREAVVEAGLKRVRPAAMTTATTLIALLPVLTSTGKGADIMVPMAIPTFGGMLIQSMTMFVVPVLQCWWREAVERRREKKRKGAYGE